MAKMKVEVVSLITTEDKSVNLKNYISYMEDAAKNGVDLIVFPEYSLTGLPKKISMNTYVDSERVYFEENAEYIPEGPSISALIDKAKELDIYACWSMMEKDKYYDNRIYNTAVMVGPEGVVGSYRKYHRAGTEAMYFQRGDFNSDVFDTKFGKVGFVICFDKVFPEAVRELKLKGAEIIISPTAWPYIDKRLGNLDPSMQLYRYAGRTRAVENGVVYIDANIGCKPGDTASAEAGHARIVDAMGNYLAEGGNGEEKLVAEIDPQASIEEYYSHLRISKEQHIKWLEKQQQIFEKGHTICDAALIVVDFYAHAIGKTALDVANALMFKYVLKK